MTLVSQSCGFSHNRSRGGPTDPMIECVPAPGPDRADEGEGAMFEAAELGTRISKEEYKAGVPALRKSLLEAQQDLRKTKAFPVIVVLAGLDTAGRSETANLLNAWMDPRWIVTRAWGDPSDEERERPAFWRYWRWFPAKGRLGLFLGAWYEPAVRDRVERRCGRAAFKSRLDRIATLEQALTDDGALILKFWLHVDADSQRERLKAFRKDPLKRWRVTKQQWRNLSQHDRIKQAAERAIRQTSTTRAPWHIVEGTDERYRNLTVATHLRDAILERAGAGHHTGGYAVQDGPARAKESHRQATRQARPGGPAIRRPERAGPHPDDREEAVSGRAGATSRAG